MNVHPSKTFPWMSMEGGKDSGGMKGEKGVRNEKRSIR